MGEARRAIRAGAKRPAGRRGDNPLRLCCQVALCVISPWLILHSLCEFEVGFIDCSPAARVSCPQLRPTVNLARDEGVLTPVTTACVLDNPPGNSPSCSRQAVPVGRSYIEKKDSLNVSPRRYPASGGLVPPAKADSGMREPQRRIYGTTNLNRATGRAKQPRYNERRRRCRLHVLLGGPSS